MLAELSRMSTLAPPSPMAKRPGRTSIGLAAIMTNAATAMTLSASKMRCFRRWGLAIRFREWRRRRTAEKSLRRALRWVSRWMRMGRMAAARPASINGLRNVRLMRMRPSCPQPEPCPPREVTDKSPIETDIRVEQGIVDQVCSARIFILCYEAAECFQIRRPDLVWIREQPDILLQVFEDGWFLKREFQFVLVEQVKNHNV